MSPRDVREWYLSVQRNEKGANETIFLSYLKAKIKQAYKMASVLLSCHLLKNPNSSVGQVEVISVILQCHSPLVV